jgi:glutathione S-transferase
MACAIELGLYDKIVQVPAAVNPVEAEKNVAPVNPAAKLPTLMTEDGQAIYDSRVIVEYLDALAGGGKVIPHGTDRWKALVLQSTCDEALDACLLARYESVLRPEPLRWAEWKDGQLRKVANTLDMLEGEWNHYLAAHVNVGVINACVLLGYLDFRFPEFDWRKGRPKLSAWYEGFAKRPAMEKTAPRL